MVGIRLCAVVASAGVDAGVLLGLPSATEDGTGWTTVNPVELTACWLVVSTGGIDGIAESGEFSVDMGVELLPLQKLKYCSKTGLT